MTTRCLFVEPLLRPRAAELEVPATRYDAAREITVLEDGTPAVNAGLDGWASTQLETRTFPADTERD